MTREEQLCEARSLLGLPHPVDDDDDVTVALRLIEFRDRNFRATRRRYSQPAKRLARTLAPTMERALKVGLPVLPGWAGAVIAYRAIAVERGDRPKRAEGFRSRLALQQAYFLLEDRGRPADLTLDGDWLKLTAILLGHSGPTPGLLSRARQLLASWK
jgi:hypothetical protein